MADTPFMETMLEWHYENRNIHLLSILLTQVILNTIMKGDSFTMNTLCDPTAAKSSSNLRSLTRFLSQLLFIGLTDAKKIRVINEKIEKAKRECQVLLQQDRNL